MRKISKIANVAFVSVIVVFCLAACGGQKKDISSTGSDSETVSNTKVESQTAVDEVNKADESTNTSADASAPEIGDGNNSDREGSRVLVAYFSATGTTKKLAEYAAEAMGADLYEIVPEEPYSDADLDWNDKNSRTSIEMNDDSIKPAINGSVADMGQYDIVFIGYPIWWGDAPHIMDTFMESYDFSGKTIIPFCSHGGGRFGQSITAISKLTPDSVIGESLSVHYSGGSSLGADIDEWLEKNHIQCNRN